MKAKQVRDTLLKEIRTVCKSIEQFCVSPGKDFVRNRKMPIEKLILTIIGMGNRNITNELLDFYDTSPDTPTASAFVQQRDKLKPEALETIFKSFSIKLLASSVKQMSILAVDGSDVQIATNPADTESYFTGMNGQHPYNLLHLNALYDLNQNIYLDSVIQKKHNYNEHLALISMVDRSTIPKALLIADRGYESYNNMAHIQEKGWFFLIRIKDGIHGIKDGLDLPTTDTYDVEFNLKLTKKNTKETKELFKDKNHYKYISHTTPLDYLPPKSRKADPLVFYKIGFRVVRFPISSNDYETVITNLDSNDYPPSEIKRLYAARWGIESSFRALKYTLGMVNFHSKKVACILQEIYAHLIMYNFAETVTSQVSIRKKQRKHTYKANFTVAVHMCRLYYRRKTTLQVLETVISKNLLPIRPDRSRERKFAPRVFRGFLYRVA